MTQRTHAVLDAITTQRAAFKADPAKHGCRSETVIALNFEQKLILIGGTEYAKKKKKSVFTLLN